MEINNVTVQFQKNILTHSIKNVIQEEGITNIENLEKKLISRIELEIYSMTGSEKFDLSKSEIIPFMMLIGEINTHLIIKGMNVQIQGSYVPQIDSYTIKIEWENDRIPELILISISVKNEELNVQLF